MSDLSIRSSLPRPAAKPHLPAAAPSSSTQRAAVPGALAAAHGSHYAEQAGTSTFQRCLEVAAEARASGGAVSAAFDGAGPQQGPAAAAQPTVQGMAWGARAGHISHARDLHIGGGGSTRQRGPRGYRNSSLEASIASLLGTAAEDGGGKPGLSLGGGGAPAAEARGSIMASSTSGASGGYRISTFDSLQLQVGPAGTGASGGDGATARSTSDSVPSLARLGVSNASERLKRLKTQRERSARIARQLRDAHWKAKPIEVVGGGVQAGTGHRRPA